MGQTGPSCETAKHRGGGDLIFAAARLARRSATRSYEILPWRFLFQTQPEQNISSGGSLTPQLSSSYRGTLF